MPERIVIDPILESTANAPLELMSPDDDQIIGLVAHSYPSPDFEAQFAGSADTEGELIASRRYRNRQITLQLEIADPGLPAATNKATNPKAAIDTTGWTNNSLTLMERKTALPARLDRFDTAIHATGNADDDAAYLTAAVTNAVSETFTAWVYVVSGTVRLEVWNATPALFANSANIPTGSWQQITVPYTPNATANWTFRIAQNGSGTSEFYVTGAQIGPAFPYFDGDTPGCSWSGTRHASSSSRPSGDARAAAALAQLQAKVSKLAAEGGTYRRVLKTGEVITFDIVSASNFDPTFDQAYHLGSLAQASIALQARPAGRGDAITLSMHTATANQPLIFTETGIKGDVAALGHLRVGNVTNARQILYWGVQSRNYDSAATAALFFEAENGTSDGVAVADPGPSGASGGGTNKTMKHLNIGTSGTLPSYDVAAPGSSLTHVGTFRIFARVQPASSNTGLCSLRLTWRTSVATSDISNDWVAVAGDGFGTPSNMVGTWALVDLGLITIPKPLLGSSSYQMQLSAMSTVATDDIYFDWVMFLPADEGSGFVTYPRTGLLGATEQVDIGDSAALFSSGTPTVWSAANYLGDYLRVPPAGAEARSARFVAAMVGTSGFGMPPNPVADAVTLDAITATLTYTPRFLVVPAP